MEHTHSSVCINMYSRRTRRYVLPLMGIIRALAGPSGRDLLSAAAGPGMPYSAGGEGDSERDVSVPLQRKQAVVDHKGGTPVPPLMRRRPSAPEVHPCPGEGANGAAA